MKKLVLYLTIILALVCSTAFASGTHATPTPTPRDSASFRYSLLKKGDSGDSVLIAKEKLFLLGYFSKKPENGKFTNAMKEAVMRFEEDYDLSIDGELSSSDQLVLFSATIPSTLQKPTQFHAVLSKDAITRNNKTYHSVNLKWKTVKGAKSYSISYSVDGKTYTLLSETEKTTLNDQSIGALIAKTTKVYYRIKAIGDGCQSRYTFATIKVRGFKPVTSTNTPKPSASSTPNQAGNKHDSLLFQYQNNKYATNMIPEKDKDHYYHNTVIQFYQSSQRHNYAWMIEFQWTYWESKTAFEGGRITRHCLSYAIHDSDIIDSKQLLSGTFDMNGSKYHFVATATSITFSLISGKQQQIEANHSLSGIVYVVDNSSPNSIVYYRANAAKTPIPTAQSTVIPATFLRNGIHFGMTRDEVSAKETLQLTSNQSNNAYLFYTNTSYEGKKVSELTYQFGSDGKLDGVLYYYDTEGFNVQRLFSAFDSTKSRLTNLYGKPKTLSLQPNGRMTDMQVEIYESIYAWAPNACEMMQCQWVIEIQNKKVQVDHIMIFINVSKEYQYIIHQVEYTNLGAK